MTPTNAVADIAEYHESLTARKGCKIVQGNQSVSLKMRLPSNLLQRQSTPMLRTNLSAAGRDLYTDADLNTLVILPNLANNLARMPYGVIHVSTTIRFAGRVNPDSPQYQLKAPIKK